MAVLHLDLARWQAREVRKDRWRTADDRQHTHAHDDFEGADDRLLAVASPADEPVGLPAPLTEKHDGHVVRFAGLLRQGVMAASVALRASTTPAGTAAGMAPRTGR